ncbi:hypothetical protein MNEG_12061 [Monoraphidium neglectum]|uniref:Uncharacterized protein n=1 Tax=Monoraphidium neglectum TaxID=145388 RepID=A0A0D2MM57_9CHLO|nr:hypothetical protein MNEG_12061 [Monoraphidium neglectum]KIY95900.1 hypothetical protein MNEG_12061 [Monoraphidium neglectum]|eukprot:XP_013894920.1 hypothetical protein MNEG_12061 [Monoraphidium neglectum]
MRVLAIILLAGLVAGAAAQVRANDFNFFPSAAAANCTQGDCAFPAAWWRRNQTEYKALGNANGAGLLKIAVSDYFPEGPTLYVVPGAWCDTSGALANASTSGLRPRASRRRFLRFLMADEAKAWQPPSVTVNGGMTCTILGEDAVSYKVGGGAAQAAERVNNGAYKIPLPNNMADGETCVEVMAVYNTSRVATSPRYDQWYEPLGEDTTTFSRKFCLYKLTKQADATLKFDMCTSNKFTLNISNITPLPVNVSLNDKPLPANLFRPLIKMWGGKVSELDGSPSGNAYDELSSRSEANYIAKFFPIASSYAGEKLSFPLSEKLQEGYYEVSAVISIVTQYPALTNLTGLNQITQDDESGTSSKVTGLFEAASRMIHNATLVGVQKNSTLTTLSAISSASHSAGEAVQAGDKIVLNWKFRGIGSATCTHDGQPASNAANGKCVSPLTITAKDFGSAKTRHKVEVTFTDVCGRVKNAGFEYNQEGVKTLSATEALNDDGTIRIVGGGNIGGGAYNAAGGLRAAGSLVLGVLGALVLLLL